MEKTARRFSTWKLRDECLPESLTKVDAAGTISSCYQASQITGFQARRSTKNRPKGSARPDSQDCL